MFCRLPLQAANHAPEKNSRAPESVSQEISSQTSAGSFWPLAPERSRLVGHFSDDVRSSLFAEAQLVLLTFCTGIQDVTTFLDYHCFASNQTGNTVFLCIALIISQIEGDTFVTANVGMSLGVFLAAGWLTGQLSHVIGGRKRWWLVSCNLLQTALVFTVAGIQYRYGSSDRGPVALGVIALLAFAAGGQVVQSRSLRITEISTAMATAAWVDLVMDGKLFVLHNRPRNRRLAFLIALAVGSLVGAAVYRQLGSAAAIAISAAGKLLVTILFLFSPAEIRRQGGAAEV